MKELYLRFSLDTDYENETRKFRNKIQNILYYGELGQNIFSMADSSILWEICNELGLKYPQKPPTFDPFPKDSRTDAKYIFTEELNFDEYLLRLQVLIDILWKEEHELSSQVSGLITTYLSESALELSYFVKSYKRRPSQIFPSPNKRYGGKAIEALDQIEGKTKYEPTIHAYEAGMKLLAKAKTNNDLKRVVNDMASVADELVKSVFGDKNLGYKHLFQDRRYEQVGFSKAQERIFDDHRKLIDQIKHGSISDFTKEDVEMIVYLTSELILRVTKK